MTFRSSWVVLAFVVAVSGGTVLAQAAEDGQQPPSEPQTAADQVPAEKPKCVTSSTAWKEDGKAATFEIELANTCDMRLKCTIDAFVIGARGQAQGHGTVILAAAPKGQTTRGTYAMKVKSTGGMANIQHKCQAI